MEETLVETCFCQDGLNLGLNRCWQKLANPAFGLSIHGRWGAYNAPAHHLAGLRGLTSLGKGKRGEKRGGEGREVEERGERGQPPNTYSWIGLGRWWFFPLGILDLYIIYHIFVDLASLTYRGKLTYMNKREVKNEILVIVTDPSVTIRCICKGQK